jgi:1,4-dihydroxy-2-naphthoate octaprenyltransferase
MLEKVGEYRYYGRMTVVQFLHIVEIRTKLISMGTVASAALYALLLQGSLPFAKLVLMVVATLCVDMGTTGFNTFFDYYRGTDNSHYTKEKEKVLVHESVNPLFALLVSMALFGLAGLFGLILASMTSWYLIAVGSVCMLVGFFYTAGPFPISRTPFGELFAGGFLGSVLFLITLFVLEVTLSGQTVLATIPFFLLIAMILSVNNGCDRIGDEASGRKTLSILLGKRYAPVLVGVEGYVAYLTSAALAITGIYPWHLLLFLVPSLWIYARSYRQMIRSGMHEEHKSRHMGFASRSYVLYCISCMLSFGLEVLRTSSVLPAF